MSEIELKLLLDKKMSSEIWARLKASKLAHGAPVTKTLRSIYLDTPEHALNKAGIARIVRGSGRAAPSSRAHWAAVVSLMTKPVGKPDAGNPHVRFDERGGETERVATRNRALPRLYPSGLTLLSFWRHDRGRASALRLIAE